MPRCIIILYNDKGYRQDITKTTGINAITCNAATYTRGAVLEILYCQDGHSIYNNKIMVVDLSKDWAYTVPLVINNASSQAPFIQIITEYVTVSYTVSNKVISISRSANQSYGSINATGCNGATGTTRMIKVTNVYLFHY